MMADKIKATTSSSIIGVYEGEALDAEITNKNGLDITREVIEVVLESEDYADGIKYGWFIGFLGHPEDPACQEFQNGCIVLTDMRIDDNGKVYATFNLIDTPVGQIVKKFIDAGVKFGISIRGAGDIVANSVDPETFMFRGFDLVAFPAYPESIPEFREIAASTDINDRKKYQAICAAVQQNLPNITSVSALEVLQQQFAPQSKEYAALEAQKQTVTSATTINIDSERIEAMTHLYAESLTENRELKTQLSDAKSDMEHIKSAFERKFKAIERITASQLSDALNCVDELESSKKITASRLQRVMSERDELKKSNLIYKQKITASRKDLADKDNTINELRSKLRETVTASTRANSKTSNLDAENRRLSVELSESRDALNTFQNAYAELYANALGVNLDNISISSSATVAEVRAAIESATNTCNVPSTTTVENYYLVENSDEDDIVSI